MRPAVYVVLIDSTLNRVGLNYKDCTLPEKLMAYEEKISLYGGGIEPDENPMDAMLREIEEEIDQDIFILGGAPKMVDQFGDNHLYSVETDLSGDRKNRNSQNRSRIWQLAAATREGDGIVRSFDFIRNAQPHEFANTLVYPMIMRVINDAH